MLAYPAHHYSDSLYVLLVLPDNVCVVVHQDPADPAGSLDEPVNISAWAPDLITLALSEPPGPASSPPTQDIAKVSLAYIESLTLGQISPVDPADASLASALVLSPSSHAVEIVPAEALVALIAQGLAIQVLSGLAAVAAKDLDNEIRDLSD